MGSETLTSSLLLVIGVLVVTASATPKCPATMPYENCTCYEEAFSVRCVNESKFGNSLPKDLPDSLVMSFEGNNFPYIEEIPYPNLQALHLDKNNIHGIADGAFVQLSNLRTLILADNPLGNIKPTTFRNLTQLQSLSLENTKLQVLSNYVFVGKYLPQLELLKIVNASVHIIQPHAFHMLEKLALLDLSHNHLTEVPEFDLSDNLISMVTLDLSFNLITKLSGNTEASFQNLHALNNLFLSHNQITRLYNHDFMGLDKTINFIDLSFNNINYTEATAFVRLHALTELDLTHNALRHLIWEELPLKQFNNSLIKLLLHDNPWNCECENSWIIEDELIRVFNNYTNFTCATPAEFAQQLIYTVPHSAFKCPPRIEKWQHTLVIVIGMGMGIGLIIIGIYLLYNCMCKRHHFDSGKSSPTSAYKRVHDDQGELILRT